MSQSNASQGAALGDPNHAIDLALLERWVILPCASYSLLYTILIAKA